MTMAATALVLAGCSNDENEGMDNGPVELRLTSGVTVQQTRAFTATQSDRIAENEVVSVWVDDAGPAGVSAKPLYKAVQLTADRNNNLTGDAMYFPATGHNIDIYAIHGNFTTSFREGDGFPTSGVEYQVEADQSSTANYTKSDLLYAYETGVEREGKLTTKELTFYHMLSKLELAIQIGDGAPKLAEDNAVTLNDVVLKGKFTPSTTAIMTEQFDRAGMLTDVTTTISSMSLGKTTCDNFTSDVFYNEAILVPQDMIGKKLTFALDGGSTLTYTIPEFTDTEGAAKFESGKKYVYHIRLDLTGLTVTSKIEPWEEVGPINGSATMD